jgi:nucleoside-diphosphate-sugar epimerase
VIAINRQPVSPGDAQRYGDRVTWYRADIACDDLSSVLRGAELVFHLAAYSTLAESPDEVSRMQRVNVGGSVRLAEACKQAGVRHLILVSSVAACEAGDSADIDESNGVPRSSYGRTKKTAEQLVLAISGPGFAVTVLRPTALFGEEHLGSVYELVKAIKNGHFVVFGEGKNRTNFYYISDFVGVLLSVANNAKTFNEVFIASDRPYPLCEVVSSIEAELGIRHRVRHLPRAVGMGIGAVCDIVAALVRRPLPLSRRRVRAMTRDIAYRNDKLSRVVDLSSGVGFSEGLRRSIAWYLQTGLL